MKQETRDRKNAIRLEDKKLLSIREFTELYGLGEVKVYKLMEIEGFPFFKNGNRTMIINELLPKFFADNIGMQI